MTIKTRISLLVTGTGFLAGLLFSVVVFFELVEQPFQLLDTVLEEEAHEIARLYLDSLSTPGGDQVRFDPPTMSTYWIEIYAADQRRLLFQSTMAQQVRLPLLAPGEGKIHSTKVPQSVQIQANAPKDRIDFRICAYQLDYAGQSVVVQIARPFVKLEEEIMEMVLGIISGLGLSTLALVAFSLLVADKILRPIREMTAMARGIHEQNLDRRLPVGADSDEFNQLAETFNAMLDRLQYSFQRQRELLFDTSHELKTPLCTIRLAVDALAGEDTTPLSDSAVESLQRLETQILRMERLVKDLLNLSSLESMVTVDAQPVAVGDLLAGLLEDYHYQAKSLGVTLNLVLAERLVVQGDGRRLQRCFSNLIDNALKYNRRGGRLEVRGRQSGNEVVLEFADTGQGIAAQDLPRVFDQFFRAESSRASAYGGYGLGLAIVKRTIEIHGGEIAITSVAGEGTQVTIRLAAARALGIGKSGA